VFYRKGLFGDRIILDQAWALDAVYAVFDRASQGFNKIERNHGRRRHDAATGAPVRNRCRRGQYRPGRPRRGDDAAIVTMGLRSVRRAGGHRHNRQRRSGLPHALPEVGDCASRQENLDAGVCTWSSGLACRSEQPNCANQTRSWASSVGDRVAISCLISSSVIGRK
jgi:hypothetical protein